MNPSRGSSFSRRLKSVSSRGDTPDTHIRCVLCKRWLRAITYAHLRFQHGIKDPRRYKEAYSVSTLSSPEVRRRISRQKTLVDRAALAYIRKRWGKSPIREIMAYLGITATTIRAHARRMGLGELVTHWTPARILREIRQADRQGVRLHSGNARHALGPLYRAGIRHFGSWRKALAAAGLSHLQVSLRAPFQTWSKDRIFEEIRRLIRDRAPLDYTSLQREHAKLHSAARNHFGSWTEALRQASLGVTATGDSRIPDQHAKGQ
jgi:hypothetical protein